MSIVHLIKDESLGGIEREYVEVDRKAEVGELVTPKLCRYGRSFTEGKAYAVKDDVDSLAWKPGEICVTDDEGDTHYLSMEHYRVLEPTDIVHIDGAKNRLVDRKAEVGEKVLIVNAKDICGKYENGSIITAERSSCIGVESDTVADNDSNPEGFIRYTEYRVLEPVADEVVEVDETQASPEVLDLLANLARRVTEIERILKTPTPFATQAEITGVNKWLDSVEQQLHDTQGNVERLAEELAAGKPVVINTPNITVNENVDVERIMQALAARLGGMSR
ncbi:hypothetical protein [Heyndrickxia oleronia]|uniref:Uncharacterized protein n=1 Tax=Heyndrickxia oleronia TaxID=38875 RepID=A0AAW6SSP0_9BACI|nr:hypothetical protein [Heyndrickxia oleronia]MDH5159847.1 hypothetical protein [Heyndrickxia oleronia]